MAASTPGAAAAVRPRPARSNAVFELIPHTADVRLRVRAAALDDLFRDAMRGMYAVMRAHPIGEEEEVRSTIAVDDSADTTSLLVDFLNEVLGRAHIGHEMFIEVAFSRLVETSLTAELRGVKATFEEDVKAVTYHEAEVRREGGEWTTMLVFDL